MNQENLIFSYTRSSAIKDGSQVCVSDHFPSDTSMYKFPVYFTQEVWKLCQQQGVIVWNICYMAIIESEIQKTDSSIIEYFVIVEGASRTPDLVDNSYPCYRLLAECGAKDINDPTPVITIMFPEER